MVDDSEVRRKLEAGRSARCMYLPTSFRWNSTFGLEHKLPDRSGRADRLGMEGETMICAAERGMVTRSETRRDGMAGDAMRYVTMEPVTVSRISSTMTLAWHLTLDQG
ncbi:hypothetical protein LIA77_10709 [Sarocladium implicatum]|nr:hypothetical protein LIA77_10709 [Sarocladium implicatum]